MIYSQLWGDINTASSRLRVLNIQPHIKNYLIGSPEETPTYDMSNYKSGYKKGDVLIIQKMPLYDEMKKAQKAGCKVIYDIDDKFIQPEFIQMIKEADTVTTDTDTKKAWLLTLNKRVEVIPDSLDWDGTESKGNKNGVIGWVGYSNNSHYLNDIEIPEGMKLRLITDPKWVYQYKDQMAQSRPWSIEMVDKYLSECELSLYYMPDGDFETCKGEHKLLKSLAIGIPTFTSPIPSYVKVFREAGVGDKYIVKNKEDWKNIKNIGFDNRLRDYAMKFKAENVAKIWEDVILKV